MKKPSSFKSTVGQHEKNKNAPPRENDPNRLSWPGLRISGDDGLAALPYTRQITDNNGKTKDATEALGFRILPEHPEYNPNGYVQQIRYKLYMPGAAKPQFVVSPESLGSEDAVCPYRQITEAFDYKFKTDDQFRDWWDSINVEATLKDTNASPEAVKDALFKKHYLEFIEPWVTFFLPVVLYASCEEKQRIGSRFKDYVKYKPDNKSRACRLLELGNWKTTQAVIDSMDVVEDFDLLNSEDQDERDSAPLKVNSATHGIKMQLQRLKSGDRVFYELGPAPGASRGPLPKEIREKLDPNIVDGKDLHEFNYPRILDWKVKKDLKSVDDLRNLLLGSTLGDTLVEKGIFSVAGNVPSEADLAALDEEPAADDLGVDELPFD